MKITTRICLLCLAFWSGCLFAQVADRQQLIDRAAVDYMQKAGNQSALFSGSEHEGYSPRISNHPYYKDEQFAKARLSYCGIVYPEALLRLDLNRKQLVTQSPGYRNIVLFPENVDYAEIHGQTIIYLRHDNLPGCPSTDYYILLHSGKCKVLKNQTAVLSQNQSLSTSTLIQSFTLKTNFFLLKDNVYYSVKNKRSLLNALYPYKKELKRFISVNKLYFRKDPDMFISQTVREYEKISGAL